MIEGKPCSRLSRPWLWLPSQLAHDLSPLLLPVVSSFKSVNDATYRRFEWEGLDFRNPIGIAGGVDKTAASLYHWQKLGAGFLEVGTLTPRPQKANPGKIMGRNSRHWALWNKMGFPNPGVHAVKSNLQKFLPKKTVPLFINIGKNRDTDNDRAYKDYIICMEALQNYADVFVINVSSPNTKGLRELQSKDRFLEFLDPILKRRGQICPEIPVLLKISPDLDKEEFVEIIQSSEPLVEGWIVTNTTKSRNVDAGFSLEGGMSGLPLQEKSRQCLEWAVQTLGENRKNRLIVSAGGIIHGSEVKKRLEMGAHLVQSYSGLVFEGPGFFKKTLNSLRSTR